MNANQLVAINNYNAARNCNRQLIERLRAYMLVRKDGVEIDEIKTDEARDTLRKARDYHLDLCRQMMGWELGLTPEQVKNKMYHEFPKELRNYNFPR